jgi:hypothetical protein
VTGQRFVRFTGFLSPTSTFELGQGWETDHIAHPPSHSTDFAVEVLDAASTVTSVVAPEVDDAECWARGERHMEKRLVAYIPVENGVGIRLRHGDNVIFETDLGPEPPTVRVVDAQIEGQRLIVKWEAQHDRPLTFNVAWFVGRGRAFPLGLGLEDTEAEFDIGHLPGGEECFVAVVATDNLRSASAVSRALAMAAPPAELCILSPGDGDVVSQGVPISLYGQALDRGGEALDDRDLEWLIDGVVTSNGRRVAATPPLEPGEHRIALRFKGAGDDQPSASHTIRVALVEGVAEWLRLSAWLDEHPRADSK